MHFNRTDEEFASDILFCRNKPLDSVKAIRSDTISAVFTSLLSNNKSTKIQTETHNVTITVRKRRSK